MDQLMVKVGLPVSLKNREFAVLKGDQELGAKPVFDSFTKRRATERRIIETDDDMVKDPTGVVSEMNSARKP